MRGSLSLRRLLFGWASPSLVERLAQAGDPAIDLLFADETAGLLAIDRDARIVRTNEALRRMVPAQATLAAGASMLPLFVERDGQAAWAGLQPILHGRPARAGLTARLRDGEPETVVAISAVPLRDSEGPVGGLLLRLTDTGPQRRLEAQLAHGQKLQAIGELAGGVAHDFNNLLTAVLGAADLVLAHDAIDAETREDVDQIRRSAQRGADLVRQLLAFGRQQTLQPRVLAVNEAVADLARLLVRLLGESIRLHVDLETPGRCVRVDPTQFDQVLMNLAVNARDAMPEGGVLTVRTGHLTLYDPLTQGAETIQPGRYVLVEVQDTGTGIPAEILPRLCEPFFTTKRARGGSGLGLSTVHGIIRQSGGVLTIESEVGRGATVRIYLPRDEPDPVVVASSPAPAPPSLAPLPAVAVEARSARIVLLVEDEEPVRRLAERVLTRSGWRVLAADCGEEALKLLRELPDDAPISALISDVAMPGMDGPALIRAVRERHPGLPAILVSGYAGDHWREGERLDDATFLGKPYSLKELAETAERVTAPATGRPGAASQSASQRSLHVLLGSMANTDGTIP